ncbi:nitrous oxide-stimulated promoter family protein [Xylanibacter oryzae]|uniref:nitrous oxide-stimulated promoter family protein n=1 Tax=Xylanibacter oryzae TaxID=185293 RepID=UPI0004B0FD15|nr:nitrous oxide-stimulated promoter family protein [Xylanibacter oryzae]
MGKIEKDKQTIRYMVDLYCKNKLKMNKTSEEYEQLIEYAFGRRMLFYSPLAAIRHLLNH